MDDVEALDTDLDTDLDADPPARPGPPERPDRPAARRRRRRLLAAGVAVVALVTAGLVRQAVARDAQGPPLDGSASALELFPALREAGEDGAGGAFPTQQAAAGLGVLPGTAHLVTATPGLLFWVAQGADGGVCLVVRAAGSVGAAEEPPRLGGRCTPAAQAASRGISLAEGQGVGATLVPEGFDTRPLVEQGYAQLADGLWLDERTARQVTSDAVDAVAARPVVPAQAQAGGGRLPVFLTRDAATYAVVVACVGSPDAGPGVGAAAGGGLAADPTVGLAVDGDEQRLDCSTTPAFRRFTGDGGPVRVDVSAPARVRWAARVVECEGSLQGPVCDRSGI
ncbi:hypothetical protein ACUN7V_14125 [Quadrisphaera oryzae]|uniref:hypothetical protein n=1 Tax=Quadrisphaera TaxID=317661 RepID=UPI001644F802|nr:hypothetical protein [Quadrisphaera sp. RL12-1S]MBC3760772.1 hypothetical protein [Quadrisphaera sp. RL12-1S]